MLSSFSSSHISFHFISFEVFLVQFLAVMLLKLSHLLFCCSLGRACDLTTSWLLCRCAGDVDVDLDVQGVLALRDLSCIRGDSSLPSITPERLYDAVNVLLSYQNRDGGWATYENTRGFRWYAYSAICCSQGSEPSFLFCFLFPNLLIFGRGIPVSFSGWREWIWVRFHRR